MAIGTRATVGVMLCTSGLYEGLERAAARNEHGLSDGLRELAGEGRASTVDVTGMSWLDVDTTDALREAERRLMRDQGRKTRDGAGVAASQPAGFPVVEPLSGAHNGDAQPNLSDLVDAVVRCRRIDGCKRLSCSGRRWRLGSTGLDHRWLRWRDRPVETIPERVWRLVRRGPRPVCRCLSLVRPDVARICCDRHESIRRSGVCGDYGVVPEQLHGRQIRRPDGQEIPWRCLSQAGPGRPGFLHLPRRPFESALAHPGRYCISDECGSGPADRCLFPRGRKTMKHPPEFRGFERSRE